MVVGECLVVDIDDAFVLLDQSVVLFHTTTRLVLEPVTELLGDHLMLGLNNGRLRPGFHLLRLHSNIATTR